MSSAVADDGIATYRNAVMPIVRVAVLTADDGGGARMTDIALPAELPLRELIPAVQRLVAAADDASGAAVPVSLAPIGGAPFSLDATLTTVGVVDGDLLALQPVPVGPPAPRIVEDIADAAVMFSASRERPWGTAHIRRGATAAVTGLMQIATVFAAAHRVATGEALGLFVVAAVAAAGVVAALMTRPRAPRLGTALAVAALPPVGAVFALAVPGDLGPSAVVLGAAGVAAWSIISITLGERALALFTTSAATALGVLPAAAAAALWTLPPTELGCALILAALLLTVQAAQLSAFCARLPVPTLPAPGDPAPSALPLRVLEDLPRRVRATDAHQTGFLAAGVLLAVSGSAALLWPAFHGGGASAWAWYLVVAVAAAAALRARVWDSAACRAWLLGHSFLITTVVLVSFAVTGHGMAAWWTLAVLTGLVAAWVVAALYPRIARADTYSLPARRLLGFVSAGLDASLIPVMAYLVGLFTWVVNGF